MVSVSPETTVSRNGGTGQSASSNCTGTRTINLISELQLLFPSHLRARVELRVDSRVASESTLSLFTAALAISSTLELRLTHRFWLREALIILYVSMPPLSSWGVLARARTMNRHPHGRMKVYATATSILVFYES
ncbi:hypothetical protein PIB30_057589 [Stylosanthes scabra]|uniref:Uncharacterized protein n=1 Tax=Stylosanthes scabra TaxID=79078 RepID=A0ABU6TLT5_9FABA|nr:hypothetical protein [Stylosanthes scabra]